MKNLKASGIGYHLLAFAVVAVWGVTFVCTKVLIGARLQLSARGDLLAIAAALCWAAYSLFMGQMAREYGAVTATRKVFFYGLLTILPLLGGYRESFLLPWHSSARR